MSVTAIHRGEYERYQPDVSALPAAIREMASKVVFMRRKGDGIDFNDLRSEFIFDDTVSVAAELDGDNYQIVSASGGGMPAYVDGLHLFTVHGWAGPVELLVRQYIDGATLEVLPLPAVATVPDRISRRQFFLQLAIDDLTEAVTDWVETQPALVQIAFRESATFERADTMLQAGFAGLSFTAEQVDAFFTTAAQL
ncbi:hypothetical protein [Ancylobacter sp. G4_0304]|uniref:hypothetical protein n=1 Tax=Ancylobacter sp. G4_0304 TaxID=3114289 RepID=UPI0039C61F17